MAIKARIIDLYEEPERFNRTVNATIPGGWAAAVEVDQGRGFRPIPKWTGDSPAEIIDDLKRRFGQVVAPRRIHDLAAIDAR